MKKYLFFAISCYFCFGFYSCMMHYDDNCDYDYYEEDHNISDPIDYSLPLTIEELDLLNRTLNLPNGLFEHDYSFTTPVHAGSREININDKQAMLGRVLFFDKELSIDKTVSCGSCHQQNLAFSDDVDFSIGAYGNHTERNSIAIGAFPAIKEHYGISKNKLFWDNRARDLNTQLRKTFGNPNEMGITYDSLVSRVTRKDYYKILFEKTFHSSIHHNTLSKIQNSLGVFMNTFHASRTKFDIAYDTIGNNTWKKFDFDDFSVAENLGKKLFADHCTNCHGFSINPDSDTQLRVASNGLDIVYNDDGVGGVTFEETDDGKFKIPPIRNIGVTAPYMHDGRFATLEEVIDFYSTGIQPHPNLHEHLKSSSGEPIKFNFTEEEKDALVQFLHTLTDESLLRHPKYSDPFK